MGTKSKILIGHDFGRAAIVRHEQHIQFVEKIVDRDGGSHCETHVGQNGLHCLPDELCFAL